MYITKTVLGIIITLIICLLLLTKTTQRQHPLIVIERKGQNVLLAKEDCGKNTSNIWRVSAYCSGKCCCGKWADGITASGAKAEGKLIAAPPEIPFGTWIDIPGYGMAEVLDRGGSIKGRRLDLLFSTHQEALEWGVKYLEIKINIDKLQ